MMMMMMMMQSVPCMYVCVCKPASKQQKASLHVEGKKTRIGWDGIYYEKKVKEKEKAWDGTDVG